MKIRADVIEVSPPLFLLAFPGLRPMFSQITCLNMVSKNPEKGDRGDEGIPPFYQHRRKHHPTNRENPGSSQPLSWGSEVAPEQQTLRWGCPPSAGSSHLTTVVKGEAD